MRRRLTVFLWFLLIIAVVSCEDGLIGRVWAHSEEATVSVKTYSPIVVDGTLDDWVRRLEGSNWAGQLQIAQGKVIEWMRAVPTYINAITSKVESGTIKSPEDFSATIYTLWDAQHFYVAAIVNDDEIVTQHEKGDIWQDDALELWFDCRHDAITHTLFQDDEFQVGFSPASHYRNHPVAWAWRNPRADAMIAQMQVASSLRPGGYIIEASIPWVVLQGCAPMIGGKGEMIGFNLSAVDKDEDQMWTHVTWSGRLHSDPSQFGHLYFVDAPIDLFPSDVFEVRSGDGSTNPTPNSGP